MTVLDVSIQALNPYVDHPTRSTAATTTHDNSIRVKAIQTATLALHNMQVRSTQHQYTKIEENTRDLTRPFPPSKTPPVVMYSRVAHW